MLKQGAPFTAYGIPSHWRTNITRILAAGTPAPGREGAGSSRTPLHMLEGTITPAGLHYERHHNGVPDIDPDKHELMIHGMVRQPLVFNLNSLLRYPMETRIHYVECAGNSGGIAGAAEPQQVNAGVLHGLLSCSEWTGVKLSVLLQEAGLDPRATWLVAEGADSAAMSRSFPVWKANDDAMIALFQNGEPIRPEQGFPMRVLLPGFQGNTNVKWVRRLKVIDGPMHTRDETSRYSELMPDGKARQFMLQFEPKSVILKPSFGMTMQGPGDLRDLRPRVVGHGTRAPRRCVGRRRQELGGSRPHRARAAEGADAVPSAVDVERATRDADQPHDRREGSGAAGTRAMARAIRAAAELPLQRDAGVGHRRRRQSEPRLCRRTIVIALAVSVLAGGVAVAAQVAPPRWAARPRPTKSPRSTSRSRPTARACRRDRARSRKAPRCTRRNAWSATGRTAQGRRAATASRAASARSRRGTYVKTVNSYWPYATTVFDYIRRAMPITNPQSLSNDEVYAVTAYILSLDNVVPMNATLDAQSLPRVQMPNKDGFVNWEPKTLKP